MKQELENKRPDSEERRSIWQRWKQNLKDWAWYCKEHPDWLDLDVQTWVSTHIGQPLRRRWHRLRELRHQNRQRQLPETEWKLGQLLLFLWGSLPRMGSDLRERLTRRRKGAIRSGGRMRAFFEGMKLHPAVFVAGAVAVTAVAVCLSMYTIGATARYDGVELGTVHLLSSYAAVNYPEYAYDYARLGILMFGVKSSPADYLREDLQPMPVMTLKARITSVREIGPGETVSYGRIFRAERPTKVASVSIGYADGIPRCLSGGKLRAIVRGQYAQGIGRICMDQLMLDVTGIEDVRVGDEAVFIGRQGDCVIYAEELAENAGTITNELFSRLGARVEGRCFRQEA
mgnify:CR=1 FL=1